MKFFQKLKARLFNLKTSDDKSLPSSSSDKATKFDKKLAVKKAKFAEKINKQAAKAARQKERVRKYLVGLNKSGNSFTRSIRELQTRHNQVDENFFEELEDLLVMSDISLPLVDEIVAQIKQEVKIENVQKPALIGEIVADKIFTAYANQSVVDTMLNVEHGRKNVILVVGVNGSGKTTTIAKLAHLLKRSGYKVVLAAADTFRAGAVEQLDTWAQRVGARIVKPAHFPADPASVVYQGLQTLQVEDYDVLIIDTAGRLQNKVNLMNELKKINQVISKQIPSAPHESLLVLDATTGQNGLSQAQHFKDVTPLTGIVLTKLDGTSKGGIVLTIKDQLQLAVKFVGLGEKIDDLQEFDLDSFIYGLTEGLVNEEKSA